MGRFKRPLKQENDIGQRQRGQQRSLQNLEAGEFHVNQGCGNAASMECFVDLSGFEPGLFGAGCLPGRHLGGAQRPEVLGRAPKREAAGSRELVCAALDASACPAKMAQMGHRRLGLFATPGINPGPGGRGRMNQRQQRFNHHAP
jgi:hypothetical protein